MEARWLLFLVGAGLGFLVDYLIRILDDDEYARKRTIKILDKDGGGIKLEPKKVKLSERSSPSSMRRNRLATSER